MGTQQNDAERIENSGKDQLTVERRLEHSCSYGRLEDNISIKHKKVKSFTNSSATYYINRYTYNCTLIICTHKAIELTCEPRRLRKKAIIQNSETVSARKKFTHKNTN